MINPLIDDLHVIMTDENEDGPLGPPVNWSVITAAKERRDALRKQLEGMDRTSDEAALLIDEIESITEHLDLIVRGRAGKILGRARCNNFSSDDARDLSLWDRVHEAYRIYAREYGVMI